MIDNETPVLRREDLITILEILFKLSQSPNNALVKHEDGLYVRDFYQEFTEHKDNTYIHPTKENLTILNKFSLVEGVLYYDNKPIILSVSEHEGNAVTVKPDGLFFPDIQPVLTQHTENTEIHVTQQDKDNWNSILQQLKDYLDTFIDNLTIYDYKFVAKLPADKNSIDPKTFYLIKHTIESTNEEYYIRYIYKENKWVRLDVVESYDKFALKTQLNNYLPLNDQRVHKHDNLQALNQIHIDEDTGRLLFGDIDVLDFLQISQDPGNAINIGSDGKLFVKDLSSELNSITKDNSLSKTVLLEQDCNASGIYELEDNIEEYNFLMIHYYLMPDDKTTSPYDAKMEMVDVDGLIDLYDRNIDYIIEHDYGISTFNTKLRFYDHNKMKITYYNKVCIYKIVGVR